VDIDLLQQKIQQQLGILAVLKRGDGLRSVVDARNGKLSNI